MGTAVASNNLILSVCIVGWMATEVTSTARLDTLELVQVLFRHGDRAPTNTYPTDPHNRDFDKYWPEGIAQLTNIGKRQQYELGQFLRKRYDGFIGKKYDRSQVYTISSDMDRTIMSLESNLAGLFPPVNDPWNPKIDWQPIPLRTIPWKEDSIIHTNTKCPRYTKIRYDFIYNSKTVAQLNKKYADFMRYCSKHSGLPIYNVRDLYPLLDVMYAQAAHNLTLPQWVQDGDVLAKLMEVNAIVNTFPSYTDEMKRLRGGPFLNLFIKNMQAVSGGRLRSTSKKSFEEVHSVSHGVARKLLMYSGHDSTLNRMMNTMDIFEPHCPPYASALMIELHRDPASLEYNVEFHYRNETGREPYQLNPIKCGSPCNLANFAKSYHHLIPKDWKKECELENSLQNWVNLSPYEFDVEDIDPGEDESTANWNPPQQSNCYPTPFELVFIGIGMFLCTAFVSLVTIKILQRREEDCDATSESGYKKLIDAGKTKGRLYGHGPEAGQAEPRLKIMIPQTITASRPMKVHTRRPNTFHRPRPVLPAV